MDSSNLIYILGVGNIPGDLTFGHVAFEAKLPCLG
jgi:hypothetical protein